VNAQRQNAFTRRALLRTGLVAGALIPLAGVVLRARPALAADEKLVTETPAVAAMVKALQYKDQSEKPDQNCSNCHLYTPSSGARGKCQLFVQGLVSGAGWCSSWTKKQA